MKISKINISLVKVGYSNSVLIANSSNSILVDTGVRGHFQRFKILLKKHNLKPDDIKLIVLTHIHNDHTGNLHDLVKYTGAKVLVHRNEYENLKNGFTPIPKGTSLKTKIIAEIGRIMYPKHISPKPFNADIINEDEFDLRTFGIVGKIISTPGHTKGSQSILIENKLIAGDTFINLKNGTIFPHFAIEPKILLKTWQYLFDLGIEDIYPGHGPKMKVKQTFKEFEKWTKKLNSAL